MRSTKPLVAAFILGLSSIACDSVEDCPRVAEPGHGHAEATWSHCAVAAPISALAWSGSRFVAVGEGPPSTTGSVLVSSDGLLWRPGQTPGPFDYWHLQGVTWAGSQFVAVGEMRVSGEFRPLIVTSPDGLAWTRRGVTISPNSSITSVAWSGAQLVAAGPGTLLTSPDGVTWIGRQTPEGAILKGVTWGASQFVAVGFGGPKFSPRIVTSSDGVIWTDRSAPGSASLADVAWSGERFAAVGSGDAVLTSPDGVTWSPQGLHFGRDVLLTGVAWGASQFVAVGKIGRAPNWSGVILTSSDGIRWARMRAPDRGNAQDVAWSGSRFVAVGWLSRGSFATYHVG